GGPQPGSFLLPSSAFVRGLNGAEFHTDARLFNGGIDAVTVAPTLYDQRSGQTITAPSFNIPARSQVSFDNILQTLFSRTLDQGSFGPIRFDSSGPITVSSSVNNVNACGNGAISGQWLPGIDASTALTSGVLVQLAASA